MVGEHACVPARFLVALVSLGSLAAALYAEPDLKKYWQVDDLRPGMKGHGLTVVKGTKIERFEAEVLGVLKNTAPGRDMVLCRLSGLDLDRTGVIAGMSGSPVYVEDKLVGAVAYAWPYGKEPIAGVTPFRQMHGFVESLERRVAADSKRPARIGLRQPLHIDGRWFDSVTVSQTPAPPPSGDGLWLVPLRTPLVTSGFSARSLERLQEQFPQQAMVPMQGGGISPSLAEAAKNTQIEPGAALTIALVTGDFDMSGVGTVTHVEDKRVYGWGHPFLSLGGCELPLMTGFVHTIYPRQSLSFKMGSPLRAVGVVNADVSTCVAGWLERKADMLPMHIKVLREPGAAAAEYRIEIVRQRQLLPALVFAALTNAVDQEGELPEEMTAVLQFRIECEGKEPIVASDMYSGATVGGNRAAAALYMPISLFVNQILSQPFQPVRISRITCATEILPGRRSAEIDGVELERDRYAPGETVRAIVFLKPHKGLPQRVPVSLTLPADLPDGAYSATVCDELTAARSELRSRPELSNPQNADAVLEALRMVSRAQRSRLAVRLSLPASGVAFDGRALDDLPPSMLHLLSQTRRTPVQPVGKSVLQSHPTTFVVQGSDTLRFTVSRSRKAGTTEVTPSAATPASKSETSK